MEALTHEYQRSHGSMPKGTGSWAFKMQGQKEIFWFHMCSYGEAKKQAMQKARELKAQFISVQP